MNENAPNPKPNLRDDLAALRIERGPAAQPRPGRKRRPIWRLLLPILLLAAAAAAWLRFGGRPIEVSTARAKLVAPQDIGPAPVLSGWASRA